jgi:hypothetical protein
MTRAAEQVAAKLLRLAKAQRRRTADVPTMIPPAEQMRRFLAGEEWRRVESGEVTATQYIEYEQIMLKRLAEGR